MTLLEKSELYPYHRQTLPTVQSDSQEPQLPHACKKKGGYQIYKRPLKRIFLLKMSKYFIEWKTQKRGRDGALQAKRIIKFGSFLWLFIGISVISLFLISLKFFWPSGKLFVNFKVNMKFPLFKNWGQYPNMKRTFEL